MMRKTVLLAFVVMVLAPAMVLGQKQKPVQDKYAAFRDRKEFGVPLFNKIPILNKYFSNSAVSKDFVWSNRFGGVAVVSPDGHYLVTGSQSLDLWDLESPEKSRPDFANLGPMEFELKPDNPIIPQLCWLAFTQDGSQIALTYNEKLFFLDAANAKITRTIDLPKETVNWGRAMFGEMPFALSPCGKFFACDGREDGVSCLKVIN
ncbi:MAG: hypothetical protein FWC50_07475, partial [Planctomycetaceae bacterium]|nr:hypothetical protein [Planctomycetaceae bacterium]